MCVFFFNDTATTEIYTLSLHDALPISGTAVTTNVCSVAPASPCSKSPTLMCGTIDRKSTRLNSSHSQISYAVFCLKKKKTHAADATPPPPNTRHQLQTCVAVHSACSTT